MSEVANINELTSEELKALWEKREKQEKRELEKKRGAYEKSKNELVNLMITRALDINSEMLDFKNDATESLNNFYEQLKKYGDVRNSNKGSFTIMNEAKDLKVEYSNHKTFGFDERGEIAATKLKEWVSLMIKKSNQEMYSFFMGLLDKNSKDEYDPRNIAKIYKHENKGGVYDHELFQGAIKLFKEAYVEQESSYYIRFYHVDKEGNWQSINLNWSSI